MMSAKSSGASAAFHGALDRMIRTGDWNTELLERASKRYKHEPRFPTALGLVSFDQGNPLEARSWLTEARSRLLLKAEINPKDQSVLEDLRLVETDLADIEAALSG